MAIKLVRIDDRMIHGQVVVSWTNILGVEQIIVIDNKVANDQILKAGIQMTAPQNVEVKVFSVEKFLEVTSKVQVKKSTMIILTSVKDAYEIHNGGFKLSMLNVGGVRGKSDSKRLTTSVSLRDEEIEMLKELQTKGVEIQFQMIPQDKLLHLDEVI